MNENEKIQTLKKYTSIVIQNTNATLDGDGTEDHKTESDLLKAILTDWLGRKPTEAELEIASGEEDGEPPAILNKAWSHQGGDTYVSEISELNVHPSQPLRDPWNRVINTGDLEAEKSGGEIVSWKMDGVAPDGHETKLLILND